MFRLIASNEFGKSIDFTNNKLFNIVDVDGLNQTKSVFTENTIPVYPGSFLNSSRLEKRNIVLTVLLESYDDTSRKLLNNTFITNKNIDLRVNNFYNISGLVESVEYNLFVNKITAQISIICFDPFFTTDRIDYVMSDVENLLEFPYSATDYGRSMGNITSEFFADLNNQGHVSTGCIFDVKFKGSVVNLTLENDTYNQKMYIYGSFVNGDHLVIDTRIGSKSIKLNNNNYINNLRIDSKWIELEPGLNHVKYSVFNGYYTDVDITCNLYNKVGGI